jgi:Metallo-peptidase family M12/Reprolysin family propeptide
MKIQFLHRIIYACFFALLTAAATAQTNKVALLQQYKNLPANLTTYLKKGQTATFQKNLAAALIQSKPAKFNFTFQFENKTWETDLQQADIFSKGFFVTTGSNPGEKFRYDNTALHYRGTIKGKPHSFAAISILNNQLVAVLADEKGNINIGLLKSSASNEHIIYREDDLLIKNEFACGTADAPTDNNPLPIYSPSTITAATINAEPIDMYFEADYTTFTNNGSNVTNVVNYVTSLFNVVRTIYENDSVNTKISAIKVWNTPDPYQAIATTSPLLSAFASNMSIGFPGDLAHFLSQRGLGGGIAYVDILCSSNSVKTAVSGNLSNSFSPFPVYSWSAMVITHESGHNIGSPHTQSCSWAGGAIDNCYATEGGCAQGPAPINGGTIMSYCHLTGYGINLANGFGPLPGARIRSRVRTSTCINPGVYFETTFQTFTEENADVEGGCTDYKLLTTKLKIPYAPSQPANITLLPTGNTGLIIGTNNDVEVSPLSFVLDTNNLSQTINLKIYNDALIENVETLTLNFNINANGGNAIKRNSSTTHSLNITSLDHRPDSSVNEPLYTETFDAVTSGLGNWTQAVVYGDASPNRWVIRNSGDSLFPSKAAYISNNGSAYTYSGTVAADSSTVRLISPAINAAGFSNMRLSYLYKCNGETLFVNGGGTSGGLTGLDYGKVFYSTNNGSTWTLLKDNIARANAKISEDILLPADANNSTALKIAFEWNNNTSVVNNPPFLIDSINIKGTSVKAIQTAANAANTEEARLGPNQTVHYYNPVTKNIMATVENMSAFDFGCTKVELLRTGNGAFNAWGNTPNQQVSAKAYKITPGNINNDAPYKLTLYYTNAEINGWLAATGNTMTDIRLVKTGGDITQTPPATPAVYSSINNTAAYGASVHTIVSGIFTGFSTFAIAKQIGNPFCPGGNFGYAAGINGTAYQWQVNSGIGYVTINNNAIYSGAATDSLILTAPPTFAYGYKYRCAITTPSGLVYSQEYTLRFGLTWLGTVSKVWENTANWSCGVLPDDYTDVTINGGAAFYPEVNVNTAIRSLTTQPGATVTVKSGIQLTIKK